MIDLKEYQKKVLQNKLDKFGKPIIDREFCLTYGELNEAFDSYLRNDGHIGEELADVVIYLLGISEIFGIDLEEEIKNKVSINADRKYVFEHNKAIKIS